MRLLLFLLLFATPAYAEITTVILVRHAEKASAENDPPLSDAGRMRANELVRVLGDTKIDAIYTTQYTRTKATAAPLAKKLGIKAIEFPATDAYTTGLVRIIRQRHKGQTVLVVGHSNSTVDMLRVLGIDDPPEIKDPQYDHLFVCSISGDDEKLVVVRYGAPTP